MNAVISAQSFLPTSAEAGFPVLTRKISPLQALRFLAQNLLLFPFLRYFSGEIEIDGLEKLKNIDGPCLFVANHSSHADTAIFLAALPEHLKKDLMIAAASDYFFKNKAVASFLLLLMPIFPFDRLNPHKAFHDASDLLDKSNKLLIYPEGTRSRPGEYNAFKKGFAALACKKGIPVLPVFIEGGHEILPKGARWPKKGNARIVFLDPIYPEGRKTAEIAALAESGVRSLCRP